MPDPNPFGKTMIEVYIPISTLQVDYGATAEELEQHFHGCGAVNRVTILCNKYDGHPKGFAYIEFSEKDSVQMAMALDESLFRGRQLKVSYITDRVPIMLWNSYPILFN